MSSRPRAIFFGTPQFAVPSLQALSEVADVTLVVTQPDRKAGRGMQLKPPPVKVLAEALSIPVIQPHKVRTVEFAERLEAESADVAVVVAYGRILTRRVLDAPRLGCVNVHGSLLPKYRGAAPIHWALTEGEAETGVCLMWMDEGMDTGPQLARLSTPIGPDETTGELSERLSDLGAELLRARLPDFVAGTLKPVSQDHEAASLAPLLDKQHGRIDWHAPAARIHNLVRGMNPWPGAYSWLDGRRVKVHRTHVLSVPASGSPGEVVRADAHGIDVACGEGQLTVDELQLEGKRRMNAADFLAGHGLPDSARFATPQEST